MLCKPFFYYICKVLCTCSLYEDSMKAKYLLFCFVLLQNLKTYLYGILNDTVPVADSKHGNFF